VKLVPFDHAELRLGEPLPVPLHDGSGRLLAVAGAVLRDAERFASLARQGLYTDVRAALEWKRRIGAAMDAKLRQNAVLEEVANARPDTAVRARGHDERPLALAWEESVDQIDALLREAQRAPLVDWPQRLAALHAQARALLERRSDASLYLLVYEAGQSPPKHCAHHAALSMAICELAAPLLGWPEEAATSLALAALTMNVAVQRLHDQLALGEREPTPAMRAELAAHPRAGVRLLEAAGVTDRMLLDIVAQHHETAPAEPPSTELTAELPMARRLAALLTRVDGFADRVSRRAVGEPLSPAQAVREMCLGADGMPDEVGGALLKAVGLYPPGSFVELASGEIGIVVARGRRANLPYVATLVAAGGTPLGVPALRDTIERRHAVKAPVPSARVRVRPPHERLIAMR